jgi:hypothetical protein
MCGPFRTAEYITAPHNNADLNAQFNDRPDFSGYKFNHIGIDTEALISHQGFTAQFNGNALIQGLFHFYTSWSDNPNWDKDQLGAICYKNEDCRMSN